MKNIISVANLGKTVFYETEYYNGKTWNKVCNFGTIDSITIDTGNKIDNNPEYITVKDNKGGTTNFCTTEKQKQANGKYIAQNVSILQLVN